MKRQSRHTIKEDILLMHPRCKVHPCSSWWAVGVRVGVTPLSLHVDQPRLALKLSPCGFRVWCSMVHISSQEWDCSILHNTLCVYVCEMEFWMWIHCVLKIASPMGNKLSIQEVWKLQTCICICVCLLRKQRACSSVSAESAESYCVDI